MHFLQARRRIGAIVCAALCSAALYAQQTPAGQTPVAEPTPVVAPVVVAGRTLFNVQTALGPFSAQERAQAATRRLVELAQDVSAAVESITTIEGPVSTDVVLDGRVLLTITDADARAAGRGRADLTADYLSNIRAAVTELRSEYSAQSLWMGALYTVLITGALIGLLIALRRLSAVIIRKLGSMAFFPLRIQRVELISAERIRRNSIRAVKLVRLVLVFLALYLYLPTEFSLFPWTREYAPRLLEYIVVPLQSAAEAVLDYLPKLFIVAITVTASYLLIRLSHFLFREVGLGTISLPGFYHEWAEPTHKITRFLILAVTLVVIFPYLPGSGSPAFRGISIFLGVLFSLGSSSAIANVVAGVILTYTRAFRLGDRVQIADTRGDVVETTLLATRIRTNKNEFITVPNSMVLSSHIINYSSQDNGQPLILHTAITIGYDMPWRTVHGLMLDAAGRTSLILKEPKPFILQTSLDDFYVTYELNAYTQEASRMSTIYGEMHQHIQDCFNEAGVEIMSPHYGSLRDGNATTVPPEYLAKDYQAPAFRFARSDKPGREGSS